MNSDCPTFEQLEQHREEPAASPIADHVASCEDCRERLAELEDLEGLAGKLRRVTSADAGPSVRGYTIAGEIHRGGQGIVYRATQSSTGREVAVKVLLKGTLASERERARFDREIELAAGIRHPNVVAIIDRGITDDGRGFFAMELVDGKRLDEHVSAHKPNLKAKLRLALGICEGVAAAHRRGVLHRDLKPGNVVVTDWGTPLVLDFGLARLEDDDRAGPAATMTGEFMGTLAYAAPEQLSGDPSAIDARADVYALGVMLYELLTGRLPYDVSGPIESAIRSVVEIDPKRPSSSIAGVDTDLDRVVLHAMQKDPARRYQSVEALADDLRRVLDARPILARRPSTLYQLRKFTQRHKAASSAAGVLLVGVVATIAALSVGIVRTNRANELAQIELDKQRAISGFFRSLLSEVDPGQSGPDMRVTELLAVASQRVPGRFDRFPELRGRLQHTIGETYARLGDYQSSEAQLMGAIEAYDALGSDADRAAALTVLAGVLVRSDRFDDARSAIEQAEQIAGPLDDAELSSQLAYERGTLRYEAGEFDLALADYEQAIEQAARVQGDAGTRLRAQALIGSGVVLKRSERFEESLACYDDAIELLAQTRSPDHPDVLGCLNNKAEILGNLGRNEESLALHEDLLGRRRRVFGPTHERVGLTLNNLGDMLRLVGREEEADARFSEAIDIFRVNPGDPSMRLAITLHNFGVMRLEQQRFEDAAGPLAEAAEMSESLLGSEHWIAAQFAVKLAECCLERGETKRAAELLEPAARVLAAALGDEHRRTRFAAELLERLGSPTRAGTAGEG